MRTLVAALSSVFGAAAGSFINVLVLRYGTGRLWGTRSMCASCGKSLRFFELVPIVSFAMQRGRCRTCRARLSLQYPAVELLTALVFMSTALFLHPTLSGADLGELFFSFAVETLLIAIFVYDLRHQIIPDGLTALVALLALARLALPVLLFSAPLREGLAYLGAGFLVAAPFAFLWAVSEGRWMGLGDAKLALVLGWLLGFARSITMFLAAFWIGALFGLGLLAFKRVVLALRAQRPLSPFLKTLTIKSEIPFAPFLIIGAAIAVVVPWDILKVIGLF